MNVLYQISVERHKPAPKKTGEECIMEKWYQLFSTLQKGQWISGDLKHRHHCTCYASTYAKGRFKTYIHPQDPDKFVLVMVK